MDGILVKNRKRKLYLGVGLFACLIVALIIGMYVTYRVGADQLSNSASMSDKNDTRLDVKVENGLAEPGSTTTDIESNGVQTDDQSTDTNGKSSDVEVRVDGTPIDVPESGSVHKQITTENGTTSIDVSTESNESAGDSSSRSSINIDVDSDSSVRVRNETQE